MQGGAGQDRQSRAGAGQNKYSRAGQVGQVVQADSQASSHMDKQSGRADQNVKKCLNMMSS